MRPVGRPAACRRYFIDVSAQLPIVIFSSRNQSTWKRGTSGKKRKANNPGGGGDATAVGSACESSDHGDGLDAAPATECFGGGGWLCEGGVVWIGSVVGE